MASLATKVVIEGDLIEGRIKRKFGIEVLVPEEEEREMVNDGILN